MFSQLGTKARIAEERREISTLNHGINILAVDMFLGNFFDYIINLMAIKVIKRSIVKKQKIIAKIEEK